MFFLLNSQHGIMQYTFERLKIRHILKTPNHQDRLFPVTEAGIILFQIYCTFYYPWCLFAFGAFLSLDSGNTSIWFFFGFQSVSLSDSHVSHSSLQVSSTAKEYFFHLNKQKPRGRRALSDRVYCSAKPEPILSPKHLPDGSLGFAGKRN